MFHIPGCKCATVHHSVVSNSLQPHRGQVPLSTGFPRQEYWSGLPFPSPGIIPTQVLNVVSCITGRFFTTKPPGKEESILWKWLYYQCNLQIQCHPYQSTNGIFHRTRIKNFTIHREIQKTLNSQSSLEKEEWSWRNQPSWLQIILQSCSHQDSMVLAQKWKYRPMEQDRKPINKPKHL